MISPKKFVQLFLKKTVPEEKSIVPREPRISVLYSSCRKSKLLVEFSH